MNRRDTLRWAGVATALQDSTTVVVACIAHCQRELARGDASLCECLRASLDCDVTCNALLRAAALGSIHTPALARVAIDAMNACFAACKPHGGHHAACQACHDACVAAVTVAQSLA